MKGQSPYQFSLFRIILGAYLAIHFVDLISHSAEVWSDRGIFADPSLNFTHGVVPNILFLIDSPVGIAAFLVVMAALAILYMLGVQRNLISLILWYGWICLFDRNNLIANPGLPFIGWLLLASAVIPKGEPFSLARKREGWKIPSRIWIGAWVIMAVSYTISGIDKWMSPSWRDGTAILHLLENPLARATSLREAMVSLPMSVIHGMTWGILGLEILFGPLSLFAKTRKWAWIGMIAMHLGILCIVDFADLTIGMLMIHVFTFDGRWFKPIYAKEKAVLFFDGVCGLCNSSVDWFMQTDEEKSLQFAPLQSDVAKELIPEIAGGPMNTLVLYKDGKVFIESTAVIKSVTGMGGMWRFAIILLVIPAFIRNAIYRWISKNRYSWFGKKESCRMPTPEERERILW
ncbi:DCC1-like thiol-disulfide oxidoreductase family protein [Sanyastnella coralliicola]|uniref:DCC1-like thiol-disulfide oxidoreductase family protein n=1 Tax=Sanyastnella coralliicola TaxID=3069118 RepID=UPI0027B9BBCC|nr:DCC1-like thiol-disulfide oxidoreductase family protein [Longitalea sp. SCSIO 12813]